MQLKPLFSAVSTLVTQKPYRHQGYNYLYLRAGKSYQSLGVYTYGPCDVGGIFAIEPFVVPLLNGQMGIMRGGFGAASTRSDIILQTLEQWPKSLLDEVLHHLKLNPGYFKPSLFEPTFSCATPLGVKRFNKNLVVLSVGSDLVRMAYRHRESGLIVDPGGWWLNQKMDSVLDDLSSLNWFRKHFEKIGRIPIDAFRRNLRQMVAEIRARTAADILIFNMLSVEPGAQHYNYQFVNSPETIRRRRFDLALADLSRELDFSILDVDKVLKGVGVKEQVDFGHCPIDRFAIVAEEIVRIMEDCHFFGGKNDSD